MSIESILAKHDLQFPPCGAECGPGWYGLLDELFKGLKAIGWNGKLGQVKEKFGGLRVYLDDYPDNTDAAVKLLDNAERASLRTCEACGNQGECRTYNGWMSTRCQRCWSACTNVPLRISAPAAEEINKYLQDTERRIVASLTRDLKHMLGEE